MIARSTIVATALIGLLTQQSLAQVAVSTQQSQNDPVVPIYRVTVVGRTTAAINYRPRSGATRIDLVGTALLADAHGVAEISGKNGHMEIDARFVRMQAPTRFGSEYLTYVLWAITPEGRPRNLGEIEGYGGETRKRVTTELQAFALIVTAEPYFAVSQPSDVVVMENAVRADTRAKVETVQARYELLPRGSYLMNRPTEYRRRTLDSGVSLDLAEARNALELARLVGADRYAADVFTKAARLLAEAETAREKSQSQNGVMMSARQSTQTAEDARLIAVKRQEEEFTAQQQALAAQQTALAAEREQQALGERQRAEREAQNAAQATAEVERGRLDIDRVRDELHQVRVQALKAQAAAAVAEQDKKALREQLREQLNMFLETRETARGLIMMVPDVLFESGSARLTAVAREKLARVSGILGSHPDLHIMVEGHTDNVGEAEPNQRLSERRAQAVLGYLVQQKIPLTAVDIAGLGETRPVTTNETAEGRQQNRRVELVVSGESIGRVETSDSPQ